MVPAFEVMLHAAQNGIDQHHTRANEKYGQGYDHACSLAPRTGPGPYHGRVALHYRPVFDNLFATLKTHKGHLPAVTCAWLNGVRRTPRRKIILLRASYQHTCRRRRL